MTVSGFWWFAVWLAVSPVVAVIVARRLHKVSQHYPPPGRGGGVVREGEARPAPPPGPVADQTPTPTNPRDSRSDRPPSASRTPRAS